MLQRFPFILLLVLVSSSLYAQENPSFAIIKKFTDTQAPGRYDSSQVGLVNRLGNDLHYLYPLYQAVGWESKFKKKSGKKDFYAAFSQYLANAGDYENAAKYLPLGYDNLSPDAKQVVMRHAASFKDVQLTDAKTFIIGSAIKSQVVMIDESPSTSLHRAFTSGLLKDLYNEGFRYLAMESFNNRSTHTLQGVSMRTGDVAGDPVGGELARKALRIGFILVSYEDTLAYRHTANQTDSVRAVNLYKVIQQDRNARIVVQANYRAVSEQKSQVGFIPMALRFKQLSGIDPLTIEQTGLTEGSYFEYGNVFYNYFTQFFTIAEPSVLLQNRKPVNPLEELGYDIVIMHPPTQYRNARPTWADLFGERKETFINTNDPNAFFVQAYYETEWRTDIPGQLVPADQTYRRGTNGNFSLYLRPGTYKIVIRDSGYKVIDVIDRQV